MKRQALTSMQWLKMAVSTLVLLFALYGLFNIVTDPFGVFGDHFFKWWSYDFTENPRVSKISYLKQHKDEYNSFIIGSSACSSFPIEELNEYTNSHYFNMIMYDSDMLDVEQTAFWLVKHCKIKNLMLCVGVCDAMQCDVNSKKLTDIMHCEVDKSNFFKFYAGYLFADWRFGKAKIDYWKNDGYLQADHDCFNPSTGAYDKSKRDIEGISDLESYVANFTNYPHYSCNINCLEECMSSISAIKKLCEENNIKLTVVSTPMYSEYLKYYHPADLIKFGTALAEITDYWDFSKSSASFEPRYFYDETHFRNALGSMALARIYGNEKKYIPEDFGFYIRKESAKEALIQELSARKISEEKYTAKIPILYYPATYNSQIENSVTTELFESHIKALYEAGCTAVDFNDLKAYVEQGKELPEKPVLITFDDGYLCNFANAGPILEKYGFKATIFAIGVSVGKDVYKDTGRKMNPHFSIEEAREMIQKGIFHVQSHGYNLHEVKGLDQNPIRIGILPLEDESEKDYINYLRNDLRTMSRILLSMGETQDVFAYPYGKYTNLSEVILKEEGIYSTVTLDEKVNTLVKGLPQSLRTLGRFSMKKDVTAQSMLEKIGYAEKRTVIYGTGMVKP